MCVNAQQGVEILISSGSSSETAYGIKPYPMNWNEVSAEDYARAVMPGHMKGLHLVKRGIDVRNRLALILAIAILAICVLSVSRYLALERELTDAALGRRATLGSLVATTLAVKFERLIDVGTALATRVRFQELVAAGRWIEAAQILRRIPEDFDFVDRLFLADVRGNLMADIPEVPEVKGTNFSHRDWYRGVSREWKPHLSHLYRRSAAPQRNVVAVAVPIRDRGDAISGILVLQVELNRFFEWVRQIDFGPGSRVLVVDAELKTGFDSTAPVDAQEQSPAADPVVQRLLPAAPAVRVARDSTSNRDLTVGYAPATHGWGVVTLQPADATFATRDALLRQLLLDGVLTALLAVAAIILGARLVFEQRQTQAERKQRTALERSQDALASHAERLRIVHEIDRAIISEIEPEAIAAAAIEPLRKLLGVPRAIVNLFDLEKGEVEWLAAAGRRRVHAGPGVRYSIGLMGDLAALKRGEPQHVDTHALAPGPEVDALLASGVHAFVVVPMSAGGELIGAISFGGEQAKFSAEQIGIAHETATQLAIAITQARLLERVRRHAGELEERVRERTGQLEAANRELEIFSYSVSHDLRAPLRAIDGYAVMLAEDHGEQLDDEGRRLLKVVRSSAEQMGRLIDDLLRFSLVGRRALAFAEVDMRALASEIVAESSFAYPKARIELDSLPAARGDRALLRHVWSNLIGNALKYSAQKEAPRVEISGRRDGAEIIYTVRDNGAGFEMRYYEKLFNVFQRLHREDEFEGTGVGLAIVQRVVLRHGGRVWGEGAPGEGASFHFALPEGH